jgi:hypothetical protein
LKDSSEASEIIKKVDSEFKHYITNLALLNTREGVSKTYETTIEYEFCSDITLLEVIGLDKMLHNKFKSISLITAMEESKNVISEEYMGN